jgi:membrane protein implicated in regulation of membrane protease activity
MWWLIVAVALGIAEVFATFLVFAMFGIGAAAAAIAASLGAGGAVQGIAFAGVSVLLVLLLRPIARRHLLSSTPESRTGIAALIGRSAVVTEQVDAHGGRVKIGGEVWSARAMHPDQIMVPGMVVDVFEIEGVTALVYGPESTS